MEEKELDKFIEDHIVMDELDGIERTMVEFNFNEWIRFKKINIQQHPGQDGEVSDTHFKRKVGIDQNPRRLPADSKKLQKVTKSNKPEVKFYKKKKGKWTKEVFEFIKDNLNLKRKDLVEKVNKKFGLNTTYGSLSFYMSREGINKKKFDEKHLNKGNPKSLRKYQEEKGMTKKEINKSLKDMHADDPDDDPTELFSDGEE